MMMPMSECSNTLEATREVRESQKTLKPVRLPAQKNINQILKVSQPDGIHFGSVIPGNICEEDLVLMGTTDETLLVQVLVVCNEFEELDEYVFSARKVAGYDYNDKLIMAVQGKQLVPLKIALKVPNVKQTGSLRGTVLIQAQGFDNVKVQGTYQLGIEVKLELPQVTCPRMLMSGTVNIKPEAAHQLPVIRLALKIGRKVDCKVPFKNNSNLPLSMEVDLLTRDKGREGREGREGFDLLAYPHSLSIQPNSQAIVTLSLKQKQNVQIEPMDVNEVLVLKVRNSSIHFSFPLCVRIY